MVTQLGSRQRRYAGRRKEALSPHRPDDGPHVPDVRRRGRVRHVGTDGAPAERVTTSMPASGLGRIGILWRGDRNADNIAAAEKGRLQTIFEALRVRDLVPEPVVFNDEAVNEVREQ